MPPWSQRHIHVVLSRSICVLSTQIFYMWGRRTMGRNSLLMLMTVIDRIFSQKHFSSHLLRHMECNRKQTIDLDYLYLMRCQDILWAFMRMQRVAAISSMSLRFFCLRKYPITRTPFYLSRLGSSWPCSLLCLCWTVLCFDQSGMASVICRMAGEPFARGLADYWPSKPCFLLHVTYSPASEIRFVLVEAAAFQEQ